MAAPRTDAKEADAKETDAICFLSSGAPEANEALADLVAALRQCSPERAGVIVALARRADAPDAASHHERAQADLRHESRLGRLPDE